ncbi:hypothetical protein C8F04DRAFT_1076516 [Mycena alexandri]|uniref:Uncharacterized protein n=1 Tax=Mycena alexandri TaxID=1745969 RepID=A0AAD6TCP0_9AGAR|nr:hypothetical protein C8F04DRAFT_1076516 [Mycena alexandri]
MIGHRKHKWVALGVRRSGLGRAEVGKNLRKPQAKGFEEYTNDRSKIIHTWIPPNGKSLFRTLRAMYSSLSNRVPSIMDISSMMSVLVSFQRSESLKEFWILCARRSLDSFPNPIPANEWTVEPPMFRPAIPVDAVTAKDCGG